MLCFGMLTVKSSREVSSQIHLSKQSFFQRNKFWNKFNILDNKFQENYCQTSNQLPSNVAVIMQYISIYEDYDSSVQ